MHDIRRNLLAVLVLALVVSDVHAEGEPVDLLIRNARVVDGTGSPWFRSDVAISNGHFFKGNAADQGR